MCRSRGKYACGHCLSLPLRDATGKFPDYPDVDEGGSAALFKKREEGVRLFV